MLCGGFCALVVPVRILFVVTSEYEIISPPPLPPPPTRCRNWKKGWRLSSQSVSTQMPSYPAMVGRCLEKTSPHHRDTLPSLVDYHAANRQRYELRNKKREREMEREIEGEGERERARERWGAERVGTRGENENSVYAVYYPKDWRPAPFVLVRQRRGRGERWRDEKSLGLL